MLHEARNAVAAGSGRSFYAVEGGVCHQDINELGSVQHGEVDTPYALVRRVTSRCQAHLGSRSTLRLVAAAGLSALRGAGRHGKRQGELHRPLCRSRWRFLLDRRRPRAPARPSLPWSAISAAPHVIASHRHPSGVCKLTPSRVSRCPAPPQLPQRGNISPARGGAICQLVNISTASSSLTRSSLAVTHTMWPFSQVIGVPAGNA